MIQLIFEDEDLLIVNKPAGLISQGSKDLKRTSLESELKAQFPNLKLVLHHRLDKDTSGLILFGKSTRSNRPLTDLFRDHQIQKIYLAIVKNEKQAPQNHFRIINYLAPVKGHKNNILRMVVVKKGGWKAETDFKTIENFKNAALIQASPKTGRTHQIRVHLASLKMPIYGDNLYGGKSSLVPRLMLHAQQLNFIHPLTQKEISVTCEPPQDFQKVTNLFKSSF